MYQNRVHLISYPGKNPEHKSIRGSDRKYAGDSAVLEGRPTKNGIPKRSGVASSLERLGEHAAAKLRKGNHIYVEGSLVRSTFDRERKE